MGEVAIMSKKQSNPPPPDLTSRPPPPSPPPAIRPPPAIPLRIEGVLNDILAEYVVEQTLVTETIETIQTQSITEAVDIKKLVSLQDKRKSLIAGYNALLDLKARLIKAELL